MANRRNVPNGRRNDFGRNDRPKTFGRAGVSPWQSGGPSGGLPSLMPLSGGSTEATLALANNILNLLQPRQNTVPSLLDMPIRREFGPDLGRYDRGYGGGNRMGNQGNFRRMGNYTRPSDRINRKPFRSNEGPRLPNKNTPKRDPGPKAKPTKSESNQDDQQEDKTADTTNEEKAEENDDEETKDSKKDAPKTRYDGINASLLKCHICNKSMWDGRSFENHLNGRAHAIMMQKTAESYALTADTMRQEFKIREMKRTRKLGKHPSRDFYCAMCDIYAGDGATHRTTVGHRKLKKFLHPACTTCHKEMPTRIELDEHRLTPEHLKNMKKQDVVRSKPEALMVSTLAMEQSYLLPRRRNFYNQDKKDKDQEDQEDVKKEGEENTEEVKKEEESTDNENTILDYKEGDDLTQITSDMIPEYRTDRGVGRSFLTEHRCVLCKLCDKLLDSEETAEVHLRTWKHQQLFMRLISDQAPQLKQEQQENGKRPLNNEENNTDEDNWKRRKTTTTDDNDEEHNDDQDDAPMKEEANTTVDAQEDTEMPMGDELEDWEKSVDEILLDENTAKKPENDVVENPEPEVKEEVEEEVAVSAPATPSKVTRATRGRGLGRRGRRN